MAGVTEQLAVGYRPSGQLTPQDEKLFRAFQSNLLSLISHELRTPLTGVLNALGVLGSGDAQNAQISRAELIAMAQKNAQRLHQALSVLLDLAAIESGNFHARLKEVDLLRVVRVRVDAVSDWLPAKKHDVQVRTAVNIFVLADPIKLARALDLGIEVATQYAPHDKAIEIFVHGSRVEICFDLIPDREKQWRSAWSQAVAGFEGGVASPASAFGGILQSEEAFLSRENEGLGSELLLIHQIMGLHNGKFLEEHQGTGVKLIFAFPELSSEDGLRSVLTSRAYAISSELASVALAVVNLPAGVQGEQFIQMIKKHLFRATDAVYALKATQQVALVLDDCKAEDAVLVLKRLQREMKLPFQSGLAHCPHDESDPGKLLSLAQSRLRGDAR